MVNRVPGNTKHVLALIKLLRAATKHMNPPASAHITKKYGRDPFLILISCILSLRTRDTISLPASFRLFQLAITPQQMVRLAPQIIEQAIYPVGFYHQKTGHILSLCKELITQFNGEVPNTQKDLLRLPGVGLKTANLVLSEGFGIPALCVDTHVHRISNRLGLIKTRTPKETEKELTQLLPQRYWSEWSRLLVVWGQNICLPLSPLCSQCPLQKLCPQVGVTKKR